MATIQTAKVKILTAEAIGADLEDLREAAQRREYNAEGGKDALVQSEKPLRSLLEHLKKDFDESLVPKGLDDPDKLQAYVRKWIGRALQIMSDLAVIQSNNRIAAAGAVSAYSKAMGVPEKMRDIERNKMQAVLDAMAQEANGAADEDLDLRPQARPVGVKPGPTLRNRRAKKKKASRKKKKT